MRCFLAIELPKPLLERLADARRELCGFDSSWVGEKWVSAESLHITLRFLGDVDPPTLEQVSSGFGEAISRCAAFELRVSALSAAPTNRHATMIWAVGDDPEGACASLAREVDGVATSRGLRAEPHRFVPHVTLVRLRRRRAIAAGVLAEAVRSSGLESARSVSVLSATLFSSTLTAQGPVYKRLREFTLGADKGTTESES